MNGVHDMGGMQSMGPILREENEPVFHDEWERRAFAITIAMGFLGKWNIDRARFMRENRHPVDYLSSTYYELWFKALEALTVETGLVQPAEIEAGRALANRPPDVPPGPDAAKSAEILRRGVSARRPDPIPARFREGDVVHVRDINPIGHTRVPRYCRGRKGVVHRDYGVFVFPDTHAHNRGDEPQHVYSIRFEGRTLWGDEAAQNHAVYVDLWDDYLEPAA